MRVCAVNHLENLVLHANRPSVGEGPFAIGLACIVFSWHGRTF